MAPDDARTRTMASIEALSIAITVRSIPRVLQPLMATDLTIQQLKALTVIVTTGEGATGAGLAQTFSISMPSISKLVDRLAAAGLVTRRDDPADHRVRRIHATDLGRAVVRELMAARPELGGDVLARLTDDELRSLEVALRAISRASRESAPPV